MKERNLSLRGQFTGRIVRATGLADVSAAEVVHGHAKSDPRHAHADPYFCLLIAGRYQDTVGGRSRTYAPADATFSPPGFEHQDRIGAGGARFFTVSFAPGASAAYVEQPGCWTDPLRWNACGPALALTRFHVALARGDLLDPIAVEEHVFSIWASLGSHASERRSPVWLERARARLHDEFAQSPRIADLAADAAVHPVHFTRTFAQRFGVGPAEYRARLRVLAACRALAQQEPIRRIAIALGYADQGHLTRDFLQRVGMTPGAYRRILTGGNEPPCPA